MKGTICVKDTSQGETLLSVPLNRTASYNKYSTVTACRLWNALPDNTKSKDKRDRFGAEVKDLVR